MYKTTLMERDKIMKKYLIKTTYTATRDGGLYKEGYNETWYIGKNVSGKELCDYIKEKGYSRKYFAEKYIQNDKDFNKRMNNDFWKIDYEIIEVNL